MSVSNLIHSIKVGLRSKLFVCAVIIVAGYSYCYAGNPLLVFISISILFVSAEAMVLLWGPLFLGSMIESFKIIFSTRKSILWTEHLKFKKLAEQMGVKLHRKHPFGIIEGINNAYSNNLTQQVIFGKDLLQKLGNSESLALAAHEFTHLKQNHYGKTLMWSLVIVSLVSSSLSIAAPPDIILYLICAAALIITLVFISWRNEYAADAGAAKQVGLKPTISLLQKLAPPEQWQRESETHPSIHNRISRLKKM